MRHDYDLPPDWEALSDEEKSRWMTQERCRRQAANQQTATTKKIEDRSVRMERKLEARGYEPVKQRR